MEFYLFLLNDLRSFQNIAEWINLFKENNSNNERIPKYLIGNKDDLEHRVDKELIDKFLKENNNEYEYRPISTSNNDNRIEEIFQEIAEKLFNNYKEPEQILIYLGKKKAVEKPKKKNVFHVVKLTYNNR